MKEQYPYMDLLKITIEEVDKEGARGYIPALTQFTDMTDDLTAGAYTSLADAIGGIAARATGDMYVTQGCSLQFYESTRVEHQKLYAKAKIRHRGSRTCIAAVELSHEDGTIVCDGQFSYSKI
ncbi:MAG: PaaI family thioesterase [Clostridia bacterium]|nr:PaaI family thioesterase [Clostridia bacterium]